MKNLHIFKTVRFHRFAANDTSIVPVISQRIGVRNLLLSKTMGYLPSVDVTVGEDEMIYGEVRQFYMKKLFVSNFFTVKLKGN